MEIVKILTTTEIQGLEKWICDMYEKKYTGNIEPKRMRCVLDYSMNRRKQIINGELMKHENELLSDIVSFNDALKAAFLNMWELVSDIHKKINYEHRDIVASLWFDTNYPQKHPLSGEKSKVAYSQSTLWEALTDNDLHQEYSYGIYPSLYLDNIEKETFDNYIGISTKTPNWNEGLDTNLTKDLHLIMPFHDLFEHTMFALSDFIYVRDFHIEVNVKMDYKIHYK
ncbi:MAG: hypothetical protein J5709_01945 [Bacteroidales bacterium]|nr:hypothetical protein [Bacteroidales bacterium]